MEPANSCRSNMSPSVAAAPKDNRGKNEVEVRRKAVLAVLEQCHRALAFDSEDDDNSGCGEGESQEDESRHGSSSPCLDPEIDELNTEFPYLDTEFPCIQLCHMIKNQVGGAQFLKKIDNARGSVQIIKSEDGSSWEMVNKNDLWEAENDGLEQKDYVLVREEDIAEGIACFITAYLLSLKETKDLSPNQLQEALRKNFSLKKRKGKLRKAWDGSQVIYNVASWSATALGIYQNPALLGAASTAFWTSCEAISKFF